MIKFKQLSLIFQTCFDGTFVIFSVIYFETNCPIEFYNTKNFAALSNYSSFNMADTLKIYLKHVLLVSGDHVHKSDLTRSRLLLRRQEPVCVRDQTFAAVVIVVTYAPDLTMDVRLCVKGMLCGVRFSRSTLFWYSLFQNQKKLLQIKQSTC